MSAMQSLPSWLYDVWTDIYLDKNLSRKKKIEEIFGSKITKSI